MSILIETHSGWLLCHKTLIDSFYRKCHFTLCSTKECTYKLKDAFFEIKVPIVMDSEAVRISKDCETFGTTQRKRKRGRIEPNEELSNEYHSQIRDYINNSVNELVKLGKEGGHLQTDRPTAAEWLDNNKTARSAAKSCGQLNIPVIYETVKKNVISGSCLMKLSATGQVDGEKITFGVEYTGSIPHSVIYRNENYIIPPHCTFLLGDIMKVRDLIITGRKYDVILLDPPWENKSVKRKKGYATMSQNDLLEIPIKQLSNPGCLIVVWSTNNQNQISFIKNKLFPQWSVTHCADWHWVKITRKGTCIHPLDSPHKKPYENLILGRISHDIILYSSETPLNRVIENHKILVSVPSSIHSHKPPLTDVLKPYIKENAQCLELFARYLLPGWTSCGNEVLKLQHSALYDKYECSSEEI